MKIKTQELLQAMLCVTPGLSKGSVAQSDCFIFRNSRVFTMNREISCSCPSGLPPEVKCAVRADTLLSFMKMIDSEEGDISQEETALKIKCGARRKTSFSIEESILLPVEAVELPAKELWKSLHRDFAEGVQMTAECTKKDGFLKECIHVHPKMLESCNGPQAIRYPLETFVSKAVLVRGNSLKSICQLGMTKGAETKEWLHFRNPMMLRVSVRKHELEQSYMNLTPIVNMTGRRVKFPKKLADAARRAGILSGDKIRLTLSRDGINVYGKDAPGEHSEDLDVKYSGPTVTFTIHPKLLEELAERDTICQVTDRCLKIETDKYTYCSSLEMEES